MTEQIDLANIFRMTLKQWKIILMTGIIMAFAAGIFTSHLYAPQYETSAMIVVYGKNAVGGNVTEATETADVFQEIITSSLLQKKVAEAIEMPFLPGTISCMKIPNTNMIRLSVYADSPKNAMIVMHGILDHYEEVAASLLEQMVLQVLEEPKVPMAPVQLYNAKEVMLKAFIIAAGAICAAFVIYFYFRDDIKNESQVEKKLDTRLFGVVHHENLNKGFVLPFRKKKKSGILLTNPITSFGYIETFHKLCTKLEYYTEEKGYKTILISSVQENEGKSTVAANMALALAKKGKKVLLVDLDLRKPALFKIFRQNYVDMNDQIGSVLKGSEELADSVRMADESGVYLLGGNRSYKNAAKLLTRHGVGSLFEQMKEGADYVIIDTPPMFLTADAEVVMRYADAGLLVVRQNMSVAKDINDAVDVFRQSGCQLLGCILNDVENGLTGGGKFYGDSYYHKYGSGYGYYKKQKNPKGTR